MKIKLIRPWGLSRVDDVIDPPGPIAIELIKSGRAVAAEDRVDNTTPTTETWTKRLGQPQSRGRRK
jgi:hypothetical protein